MFSITSQVTVAGVTEARRDLPALLTRVERGESVVLQKNGVPVGVLMNYQHYQDLLAHLARMEPVASALSALQRDDRIAKGTEATVPLSAMLERLNGEKANHE
jgi:prevent-host-death family protein